MPIDAVIFDCDGVLVDSESLSIRILVNCAKEYGCDMDEPSAMHQLYGIAFDDCISILQQYGNPNFPPDFEEKYRSESRKAFDLELRAIDGIHEALDNIKLPIYVASNSPPEKIEYMLSLVGLDQRFVGRIFSAYALRSWKPKPDIYLSLARDIGANPRHCCVIEDSMPGVIAGLRAGMFVLAYCSTPQAAAAMPSRAVVFHHMSNLPALIGARGGVTRDS